MTSMQKRRLSAQILMILYTRVATSLEDLSTPPPSSSPYHWSVKSEERVNNEEVCVKREWKCLFHGMFLDKKGRLDCHVIVIP